MCSFVTILMTSPDRHLLYLSFVCVHVVNVVEPGYISTDMTLNGMSDDARKDIIKRVALGRMGEASDVADVVSFLLGDGGRYISGAVIPVDGGLAL